MGLVNFAHGEIIAVGGYTMVAFASLAIGNPVIVMGGAVMILFALPWLDRSPVKSIRYKPGIQKLIYIGFVIACTRAICVDYDRAFALNHEFGGAIESTAVFFVQSSHRTRKCGER